MMETWEKYIYMRDHKVVPHVSVTKCYVRGFKLCPLGVDELNAMSARGAPD